MSGQAPLPLPDRRYDDDHIHAPALARLRRLNDREEAILDRLEDPEEEDWEALEEELETVTRKARAVAESFRRYLRYWWT